uniref:Uncharacterized protein n=1 Tax=Steinernema glaseri TaxID=37863 RepID=A0A1I8AA81_9BILA
MIISRYIPRRVFSLVKYIICLLLVYFCLSAFNSRSSTSWSKAVVEVANENSLQSNQYTLYDGVDPFLEYRSLDKKDWHDYKQMEADKKPVPSEWVRCSRQ